MDAFFGPLLELLAAIPQDWILRRQRPLWQRLVLTLLVIVFAIVGALATLAVAAVVLGMFRGPTHGG